MKNERSKQAIREKMVQYMDRAEQIKTALDKKTTKKTVVKAGLFRKSTKYMVVFIVCVFCFWLRTHTGVRVSL
jgi:nitrate/nitrite-specific signal transduction histidine kinase